MKNILALLLVSVALIACSSTNKPDANKTAETQSATNAAADAAAAAEVTEKKLAEEKKLAQELNKDSVYFDFDKSIVKPAFHGTMKKQADFLVANKNVVVTLEGHCDERGSSQYNLALGERRAQSVSNQLQSLGVSKEQIKTVSRGEEQPRLSCHKEKCWKENRRVDFIHAVN